MRREKALQHPSPLLKVLILPCQLSGAGQEGFDSILDTDGELGGKLHSLALRMV